LFLNIPLLLPCFIFITCIKSFLSSAIILKCNKKEIFHLKEVKLINKYCVFQYVLKVLEIKCNLKTSFNCGRYFPTHISNERALSTILVILN
jgi:hypothetical protein